MKKKILALCLVVVLAVTAVTGATLAYFTDEEQVTNTMVIGNVEIEIDEWQYDDAWEDYEDEKFVLYPLENEQGISLYNKSVRTYNTSSSKDDVYMRSIILIEKNDSLAADYANEGNCCVPGIHFAYDKNDQRYISSKDGKTHVSAKEGGVLADTVTYNGNEYWVAWYVAYDEGTIPYDAALSSLHSVWMDKNIEQEDLAGWGEDGVQVIAFSQAIQSEGLTHAEAMEALGEVTTANVTSWLAE